MATYGEYFKALRKTKGLTLREVEGKTGISNAYLSQLETGKVKQPSPVNLYKLAEFYEVSYESLMEKVGYPIPKGKVETKQSKSIASYSRFGKITDDEELELLEYLKFIRNRKNR